MRGFPSTVRKMTLTLAEAYTARLEFYDQNQPRAKDGKWTRGGGARGSTPDKVWTGVSAHPDQRSKPQMNHEAWAELKEYYADVADRIFNTDLGNGYSSVAVDVEFYDYGGSGREAMASLAVAGAIMKDGKTVGEFSRQINLSDGEISVYHDQLVIDSAHQGAGLADRFNSHAIAEYQRLGVDHVSLEAGLETGAYAWARQGFRYKEEGERSRKEFAAEVLKGVVNTLHAPVMRPFKAQIMKEVKAIQKALDAGEDVQPIHLASIGEKYARYTARDDDGKTYETWPGKSALLGRTWDGVYYFDASQPVTASATSLEHANLRPAFGMSTDLSVRLTEALACHTAACRPPSSGGTGGSLRGAVLPDVSAKDVRFAYRPRHPDGHADPGEVVWARVPFEDDPTQGKDRPVLIVGRATNGNLVGVQLSTKTHHKGSFPIEWGSDKTSHLRPERFIQVDLTNYRKEGAYIKKPVFQEIVDTLTKRHGLTTQEFGFDPNQKRDKDGKWTTSGSAGFPGLSPTETGRVRPTHKITYLTHDALDDVGFGEDHLDLPTRSAHFIKSIFDAELPGGITSTMQIKQVPGGTTTVTGRFVNSNGVRMGEFERSIDWDGPGGRTVVHHETLVLNPEYQRMGIAEAFNSHALAKYRQIGVDRIEVYAGSTVGGYTWAVAGFRFSTKEPVSASGRVVMKAKEKLVSLSEDGHITSDQRRKYESEIDALVAARTAGEDVQPVHLASIGRGEQFTVSTPSNSPWPSVERPLPYTTWAGKEMMLGNSWEGVYYLGEPLTASAVEEFYDASQKRDRQGRWTTGGVGVPQPRRYDPKCTPPPCVSESVERSDTMARQLLHRSIVKSVLANGTPPPTLTILGGGGGAGKSTVKEALGLGKGQVDLNVDDIKERIPEYNQLVKRHDASAAAFVHEESSNIGKKVQAEARAHQFGMILDQVGSNPAKVKAQIDDYVAAGYTDIRAVYVTVPTSVAIERAQSRAARTGRVVPVDVLKAAHRDVSRGFEEIARHPSILDVQLVDNSGPTPIVIARGGKGELAILDQIRYDEFLAKGD